MKQDWAIGGAAALAVCAVTGVVAGQDAAGHVDRFYTSPPDRPYRTLPPVPQSSAWDWNEVPTTPVVDQRSYGGGSWQGDGSDLTEVDRAVERAATVRVHRGRRARAEAIEAPQSDSLDADGLGADPPEPLPSA